jgi:hypothetical protein
MSGSNEKVRRANAGRNFHTFYNRNIARYPAQLNWLGYDISRVEFMNSASVRCLNI